jgi:hypothetical protein
MKKSKRILIATFAVLAVILVVGYVLFGWMFYRYQSTDCKERGKAYGIRVERLKRDAHTTLRIGTHKEDVIRFFQENGLPISFDKGLSEYEGTIYTKGCAPAGCGSDDALLGLRVKVDSTGTVVGEPVVGALYTNCL